ncbi:hypothetical protein [Streptomyces sp. NPDC092307]|uniref:hypothetical protein n=1 Tax=Streptomyces sp. NPDC092307 TaxID=3366013 RepID=UPI0037F92434
MGRKAADGSSILGHQIKVGCGLVVMLAFATLLVMGMIFGDDEPESPRAEVGGCMATRGVEPSLVSCDSAAADVKILQIFENQTNAELCRPVPGVTEAYELTGTWRVGGASGVDIAETGEKRVVCVGSK